MKQALSHTLKFGILSAVISLALILGGAMPALASAITEDVKSTIDDVIKVVTDPNYKNDRPKRRARLREIITPQFDFEEMGKRSLGKKDWLARSPEEQQQFIDMFGKLLENSYASKLESYQDEIIKYGDEIVKGRFAMVKTKIVRKDDTINVDYKLIQNGDKKWRVYDFVIEEVSMIRNYRSQFSKIIRKDSFQALMDKMSKKVADLEHGGADNDNL